jgi:hypothetical protein
VRSCEMEVKGLLCACEMEVNGLFRSCGMEVKDLPCSHDVGDEKLRSSWMRRSLGSMKAP